MGCSFPVVSHKEIVATFSKKKKKKAVWQSSSPANHLKKPEALICVESVGLIYLENICQFLLRALTIVNQVFCALNSLVPA